MYQALQQVSSKEELNYLLSNFYFDSLKFNGISILWVCIIDVFPRSSLNSTIDFTYFFLPFCFEKWTILFGEIKKTNKLNINLNLRPQNLKSEIYFNLVKEYESLSG